MSGPFDVFLSYHHADGTVAGRIVDALRAEGLAVFFDRAEIDDFESITKRLRDGIGCSKALLAIYSATYPARRACQFELTAAFLAAQRLGSTYGRVLVLNPEAGTQHIEPVQLRDALFRRCPDADDADACADLATAIARHVSQLETPLGEGAPMTPPPWAGMRPSAATRFVGRQAAMWSIHSALHAGDLQPMTGVAGPGVAQVRGLGGIGKTMLAQEYALRFGAAFPGGIFWLHASGDPVGTTPSDVLSLEAARVSQVRALATACHVPIDPAWSPAEVEAALGRALGQRGEPFLWVVDDVPSDLDAETLRGWFAPHPLGRTLLTTRSGRYGALATAVEPSILSTDEAVDLLTLHRAPGSRAEHGDATRLAADLGCHALAVDIAGAAVAATPGPTPFATFRADLAEPAEDALELAASLADVLPTGHLPSIATTLLRSIERLGPEGLDLLRVAAVSAAAPIPADYLAAVLAEADRLSERDAAHRVLHARTQARHASLADATEDGAADSVHALVARTICLDRTPASADRIAQLRSAAVAVLNRLLSIDWHDLDLRQLRQPLIAHARQLAETAGEEQAGIKLAAHLAHYDYADGSFAAARALQERVVQALLRTRGEEHPSTLAEMSNLGATLRVHGALQEARTLQERVVELQRRQAGDDARRTLDAMNNLAATMLDQGDLPAARALQEQVLDGRLRTAGPDAPETLLAMGNLAETRRTAGDLAGARELQERVLERRKRIFGESHTETLVSMSNLATTLWTQGDLAGARKMEEQVRDTLRRSLGDDHPTTLTATINLAETLSAQRDFAAARVLQEEVLDRCMRVLGEEHPTTLTAMSNLALTLVVQGQVAEGRTMQERAMRLRMRLLGPDHPDTFVSMSNVAATLARQGELAAALRLGHQVLEGRQRVLGETHPVTRETVELVELLARLLRRSA